MNTELQNRINKWVQRGAFMEVLDISNLCLATLEDVEIPDTVQWIDCSNNPLASLIGLPKGLKKLICSNTKVSVLYELPEPLEYLKCWNCDTLKQICKLPMSLRKLDIRYCKMLEDIQELSNELRELKLIQLEKLSNIPQLPPNLRVLYLEKLTLERVYSFPLLPPNLRKMVLVRISLDELNKKDESKRFVFFPDIPATMKYVKISDCLFKTILLLEHTCCLFVDLSNIDIASETYWYKIDVHLPPTIEYAKDDYFLYDRYSRKRY